MLGRTHLLLGILLTLAVLKFVRANNMYSQNMQLVAAAIILFISVLPDIDEKNSWLGRRFKPISISMTHRGFFHSILFMLLLFLVVQHFSTFLAVVFAISFLGHLFLDGISKHGITPLWPWKFKIKGRLKTGGKGEKALSVLLIISIIVVLFL